MTIYESAPWLFLVVGGMNVLLAANVYWPVRRPAPLAVASFLAGWLTSELVVHTILLQVAFAGAFIAIGALVAWPGWVALALSGVSWIMLARSLKTARAAEEVVESALKKGLGDDYAARIEAAAAGSFSSRQLAMPFRVKHPEVERVKDIVYIEGEQHRLHLDVYRHRSRPKRCPTLLQVHGGGWVMGNKNQQGLPLVTHLASKGWLCVSANYRLSPRATFPDPLIDLKYALKWIREQGEAYGADPDFIVVTGGSAGGHLAALVALTANDPEYQPGFESLDTSVKACVAFYGIYDFTDRNRIWPHRGLARLLERTVMKASLESARDQYVKASPIDKAHEEAPPFLIVHGDADSLVPVGEARHFVETLQRISKAPVVYAEVPGAQHAFEVMPSLRTGFVIQGVERFLNTIRAATVSSQAKNLGDGGGRRVSERQEDEALRKSEGTAS